MARRLARAWTIVAAIGLTSAGGCRRGDAPILDDPGDQTAVVGMQLTLHLIASDPDGDDLTFSFEAPNLPDKESTTALARTPDGQGVFTFTPVASQVGTQAVDFIVSDGRNKTELTVLIEVVGAVGSGSLPIFRKPLGSGTVLDLEQNDCVSFDIQIEDPDSATVELGQEPPQIEDANLNADDNGLAGSWSWCPSREQQEADDRYDIKLSANDGVNPPTIKAYTIVLRKRRGADCPGEFPVITHSASDFATLLDLEVKARISDDQGLKNEPYVCWSAVDPGDPIDFSIMTLESMELLSGDMTDGEWRGYIPNPTATQPEGATDEIFYLITATDDDDAEGDCDHLVDHPESGVHHVGVTNTGGVGGDLCAQCSFDVQCGESGDLCLLGSSGSFCGKGCSGAGSCPSGYTCSANPVDSIDGASARQCVPNSGVCGGGGGGGNCSDDDDEPNDTPVEAMANGTVSPGTISNRTLCAGDDDWYAVSLTSSSKVTVTLDGDLPPDMDVAFTSAAGTLIKKSDGLSSQETFTTGCNSPGTYMIRVYTVDSSGSGQYDVTFSTSTTGCSGGGTTGMGDCCVDNNTPGCENATIQNCVCGMDAFCCDTEWDNQCAMVAAASCNANCGGGGGGTGCCMPHATPSCSTASIANCVCASDPFCCNNQWDQTCVNKVGSLLCAPSCNPDDADGACCQANGSKGCEVNSVESCVCAMDAFCCTAFWDADCVMEIEQFGCGNCP